MFKDAYKVKMYETRKHHAAAVKVASGCVDCKVWGPAERPVVQEND